MKIKIHTHSIDLIESLIILKISTEKFIPKNLSYLSECLIIDIL